MKSPFPGMDPFIEPNWRDVHASLITEARRHLNRALPLGLVARVEERLVVESEEAYSQRIAPDVRVYAPSSTHTQPADSTVVIDAPFKLLIDLEPEIERFIRIIDHSGELVTVVEILSPSNKRHPGMEDYRKKRKALLDAGVHVVEIDLTRAGDWRALMYPEKCPIDAVSPYRAVVRTGGVTVGGYLFPIGLKLPLPDVPVPLRPTEKPVILPLQSLFDAVYEDGRYAQTLNYSQPLHPPLDSQDAQWVEQVLKSAKKI